MSHVCVWSCCVVCESEATSELSNETRSIESSIIISCLTIKTNHPIYPHHSISSHRWLMMILTVVAVIESAKMYC